MRGCVATCAHRRFVRDYQAERWRQEIERDAATGGYATELSEHPPIITFKKWLTDHASDLSVAPATVEPTPDDWMPPPGF
jgi:hypothetical protein